MISTFNNLCVVSFKECWRDDKGQWFTDGGFSLQMAAIGSLFRKTKILVPEGEWRSGGIPLPCQSEVVPLLIPKGQDFQRKLFILSKLSYYLKIISKHVNRADVIHTPVPGDIAFLGMVVALFLRKPLIARYGSSWATTNQTTFMNRVTKVIMRKFAGGRNVMLVTGESNIQPAQRMHWIFGSALSNNELNRITPILKRGLSDIPQLIYIGRLSPEKGIKYLIEAIVKLKQDNFTPMPCLIIAGDGPQRQELEYLVDQNDCENLIHFTGQLNREHLSKQLMLSDLCVQPSLTEGFSKAWLDAMAHGLPVIASDVGAARAVIGDKSERGWLLPPGDVNAISNLLKYILTANIDWFSLRSRCKFYVTNRTLEIWADQIGAICANQWGLELDKKTYG